MVIIRYIVWPDNSRPSKSAPSSNTIQSIDSVLARGIKNVVQEDGSILCVDSGTFFQALESISIIQTTTNIETLMSRYNFLVCKLRDIYKAYKDDRVGHIMAQSQAIATYDLGYPSKKATEEMVSIIEHPDMDLQEFYSKSIIHCLDAFCDKMEIEINSLKTEAAKMRRREKIIELIKVCATELNARGNPEFIVQIPEIIARFNIEVNIKRTSEL